MPLSAGRSSFSSCAASVMASAASAGMMPSFAWARASADRVIDRTQSPSAIVAALNGLEAQAKLRGSALGAGFSYPVTVEAAARWTAGLEQRGLQLAPASSMSMRPGR